MLQTPDCVEYSTNYLQSYLFIRYLINSVSRRYSCVKILDNIIGRMAIHGGVCM